MKSIISPAQEQMLRMLMTMSMDAQANAAAAMTDKLDKLKKANPNGQHNSQIAEGEFMLSMLNLVQGKDAPF